MGNIHLESVNFTDDPRAPDGIEVAFLYSTNLEVDVMFCPIFTTYTVK